MAHFQY